MAAPDDKPEVEPSSSLPVGIQAVLGGSVEGTRLELKAGWDEKTTGPQVLKTLCAFGNDLQNLNGGYIVIGVAEANGVAIRPVQGISDDELDAAQKWIRGNCNRIVPAYLPVMDTSMVDGKRVLVLWAPASDARPHQAPDGPKADRKSWVRIGSETVEAKAEVLTRLLQQTARVPFDDRRTFDATNEDLRIGLAREFLHDVGSDLVREPDVERVYAAMQLTRRVNGHTVPRNVALLFFSDEPQRWFRGASIELAEFSDDAGGDTIDEKIFSGPLPQQLRQCLSWLENMTTRHLQKQSDAAEAKRWVSYPMPALREALVNAVYHRSYESDVVEPIKVYLYPNRIVVASYPGPVEGIELSHLQGEEAMCSRLRNSRMRSIG
jgi:ATP-dependent DNA helicase RecG